MKHNVRANILFSFLLFGIAFALNVVWEYLHYVLYVCPLERLPCALLAAFIDGLIIIGIYFVLALAFNDFFWIRTWSARKIFLTVLLGFFIAYFIELRGLYLERWSYAVSMPLIPYLQVGLSPIAQMIVLPLLSFFLSRFLFKSLEKYLD